MLMMPDWRKKHTLTQVQKWHAAKTDAYGILTEPVTPLTHKLLLIRKQQQLKKI